MEIESSTEEQISRRKHNKGSKSSCTVETLTEAGVLREKLGELVALVLVVAAVAAVAVGRHADFGRAQVVGSHHGTCSRWIESWLEEPQPSNDCQKGIISAPSEPSSSCV